MLTDVISPILADGMNDLLAQVQESQRSKGIRDTGASAASLHVELVSSDTTIAGQLRGFERFRYQQNGRGPNKSRKPSRELVERIRGWAQRHGIEIKAAYPIALKIASEGIEVPNPHNPGGVLSDVLNHDNVKALLRPRIRQATFKELKSQLFNLE
ncbi:hypothetical protein [Spirosoma fluminis]